LPERLALKGYRQKKGRLTIIDYSHTSALGAIWNCQCECGNRVQKLGWVVRKESVSSCGCLRKEMREAKAQKYPAFGELKSVAEWVKDPRCSVSAATLWSRIRIKWDMELAITAPSRNKVAGKPRGFKQKPRVPLKELLLAGKSL
jgi:hypothetical protein